MEQVVVGFSKPKTWKPFAQLIMWGYNIPFDHVYISYYSDHYKTRVVFQASQLLVNYMSEDTFLKNNVVVDEFPVTIPEEKKLPMEQYMMSVAGTPYGSKEALGMALVRLCQLIGLKINNPFPGNGQVFVCSTIITTLLSTFEGLKLPTSVDNIDPKTAYQLVKGK